MRISLLIFAVVFLVTIPQTALADAAWQLTFDGGVHPTWSPNGTQIAFSSERSGNWDIWVIPASGGVARQVTTDPEGDGHPAWSPDGSEIAFTRGENIWVIPASGGVAEQITTEGGWEPAWSPDGSEIAFTSWDQIWAIPANGGVARQVTVASRCEHPAWSPDGSQIAFHRGSSVRLLGPTICVVPASGGVPETGLGFGAGPAWSPDGHWIAYADVGGLRHPPPGTISAMTVPVPSSRVRLTDPPSGEPAWSPDGTQIAFERGGNIWIIDVSAIAVEPTTWGAIKASFR